MVPRTYRNSHAPERPLTARRIENLQARRDPARSPATARFGASIRNPAERRAKREYDTGSLAGRAKLTFRGGSRSRVTSDCSKTETLTGWARRAAWRRFTSRVGSGKLFTEGAAMPMLEFLKC